MRRVVSLLCWEVCTTLMSLLLWVGGVHNVDVSPPAVMGGVRNVDILFLR